MTIANALRSTSRARRGCARVVAIVIVGLVFPEFARLAGDESTALALALSEPAPTESDESVDERGNSEDELESGPATGARRELPRSVGPFPVRSLGGLSLIFYHPVADRAATLAPGELRARTSLQYASISDGSRSAKADAMFDGEILRWDLAVTYAIAEGLELTIGVPFHYTTSGFLDDGIDGFHRTTGLPRSDTAEDDQFHHVVTAGGRTVYKLAEDRFALVDLPIELKYRLFEQGVSPFTIAARAGIELPTGDRRSGFGSGGVDGSVGFIVQRDFEDVSLYWNADALFYDRPRRLRRAGLDFADFVFSTAGAIEWRVADPVAILVQIDAISNVFEDTDVEELDLIQVIGTLGVAVDLGERGLIRVGFSEDLSSAASPDVAFHLALEWRFD